MAKFSKERYEDARISALEHELAQAKEQHERDNAYARHLQTELGDSLEYQQKLSDERGAALAQVVAMRDVVDAARAMADACTRRNLDVQWTVEGGLFGKPMQEIANVSLLDKLNQALKALDRLEKGK